ncbi:DUF4199 domain-containing protein [Rubrolithibacter danxiaensis]|uniref:DUF4199 domain-containing protein n=1 Tax=Rubrolithibacter danxiaensis TaxID=3390805 RepID=UPI003BF926F9
MKNAIKFGILIGIASGIWIVIMHFAGVYNRAYPISDRSMSSSINWLEYISTFIPFLGLFFGIKNFRDNINGGRMEFFEGIFEGFKILVIGGVIAGFFIAVYTSYVNNNIGMDFMGRIGYAGLFGILCTITISLILMNRQRNL